MPAASTAYLDDAGRPRLRPSIVAFFDILGFSHIATSSATIEDSQSILDKIASAIDDSRDFVRQSFAETEWAQADRWATKFFSDNLAFGYAFDDATVDHAATAWFIIGCAQRYQLRMIMNGFFVRGALTQGPICLTDEIIFGSALIECYLLESKASIVPRVVLAEPLKEVVLDFYRTDVKRCEPDLNQAICRDVDGLWFVNYLQAARNAHGVEWRF